MVLNTSNLKSIKKQCLSLELLSKIIDDMEVDLSLVKLLTTH